MATGTHTDLHHSWASGAFNGTGAFVIPLNRFGNWLGFIWGTRRNLQGLGKDSTFYISIQKPQLWKNQQLGLLRNVLFVRSLRVRYLFF